MKHPKKISELISPAKVHIKDYSKVNYIFSLYWKEHYYTMAKEIYFYKDVEFFMDFSRFLEDKFANELFGRFFYEDMVEQYIERLEDVWFELSVRKAKKKWLNN